MPALHAPAPQVHVQSRSQEDSSVHKGKKLPCLRQAALMPQQVFKRECWNGFEDDGGRWRICYSDEHYFATVLATKGLDQVCCCIGVH